MPLLRPILVALTVIAAACGDDGLVLPDPPKALVATPQSVSAVAGDTVRLHVADERGRAVTATFTKAESSAFGVDAAGLLTAMAPGTGTVTATVTSNGSAITTSIPVTVRGFTLVPSSGDVVIGGTIPVRPTFIGDAASYGTIAWSSSNPASATVGADGIVRGVALGSSTITAVSSVDSRLRATLVVSVSCQDVPVKSLSVTPNAVTLATGSTQQLTSTLTLGACTPATTSHEVIYVSSDTTIATVSAGGLVTARGRAGVATITVAPVAYPTVSTQVTVVVVGGGPLRVTIQSITTGDPPLPVDPKTVRGPIRVTVNFDPVMNPPRVELFLNGRLVDQRDSIPTAAPVALNVDTSSLDPQTGARIFPLGDAILLVRLTYGPSAAAVQTASVMQQLTLVGP